MNTVRRVWRKNNVLLFCVNCQRYALIMYITLTRDRDDPKLLVLIHAEFRL